jgi:hypothetical protein
LNPDSAFNNAAELVWGTKFNLYASLQYEAPTKLLESGSAILDTLWNPPLLAIRVLTTRFPEMV